MHQYIQNERGNNDEVNHAPIRSDFKGFWQRLIKMKIEINFIKKNGILAIAPFYKNGFMSVIITEQGSLYSKIAVDKIMEQLSVMNGATLTGRIQASRIATGYIKRPPIMISPKGIFALQLQAVECQGTVWLFNLNFYTKVISKSVTEIHFACGYSQQVRASEKMIMMYRLRLFELQNYFCNA
ncbi:MAG: competence protein ComK [Lysinibacillus sp.]